MGNHLSGKRVDSHVSLKNQETVLNLLKEYIGKECPTNAELAMRAQIKKEVVACAINALNERKKISRQGSRAGRIITITGSGGSTLPGLTGARQERERVDSDRRSDAMPMWIGEKIRGEQIYKDVELRVERRSTDYGWRQP